MVATQASDQVSDYESTYSRKTSVKTLVPTRTSRKIASDVKVLFVGTVLELRMYFLQ
jgi:hypothetical protein